MSVQSGAVGFYRARKPQETPLYRLVEAHYGQVKGVWEEGFEQSYGFWRVFVDDVVNAYLDCGRLESGFVRVRCSICGVEWLVATSCQKRGFCPSCGTKRAAAFGAFLADEVLEEVGHLMWTFSLPKMIRPFFIYHPELRGRLCRVAFDTVQEMMAAAAGESDGFRTGMVAFAATAGDLLNINPHVHAIAPRGGWDSDGAWVPIAFIDNDGFMEFLFLDYNSYDPTEYRLYENDVVGADTFFNTISFIAPPFSQGTIIIGNLNPTNDDWVFSDGFESGDTSAWSGTP